MYDWRGVTAQWDEWSAVTTRHHIYIYDKASSTTKHSSMTNAHYDKPPFTTKPHLRQNPLYDKTTATTKHPYDQTPSTTKPTLRQNPCSMTKPHLRGK